MTTLFTRIIDGEIPGRFVWTDDECVAFLSADPLSTGHTLVVPRQEIDHWLDLDPALAGHLMRVSQVIGRAQRAIFEPQRVGQMIQGFEVPHVHIHVWPVSSTADFDFANADHDPDPAVMDDAAQRIREGLRSAGHEAQVPQD